MGHCFRLLRNNMGVPLREWISTVPNDGLFIVRGAFNSENVVPTSPEALREILVTKSYEFIKPALLRADLEPLLGVGMLLAEGDEHKVRIEYHLL